MTAKLDTRSLVLKELLETERTYVFQLEELLVRDLHCTLDYFS